MVDLVSTLIQPVTVAYLVYLISSVAGAHESIPTTSLTMIAAIYGLQVLVFIMRRKWDMIGWMVFYFLAVPAFSFFLPLYSFWRVDDFSWGATRLVLGESGKKLIVHDEGKFDPRAIPLKSWSDYENDLWDKESNHSIGSWVPPTKLRNEGYAESQTASLTVEKPTTSQVLPCSFPHAANAPHQVINPNAIHRSLPYASYEHVRQRNAILAYALKTDYKLSRHAHAFNLESRFFWPIGNGDRARRAGNYTLLGSQLGNEERPSSTARGALWNGPDVEKDIY